MKAVISDNIKQNALSALPKGSWTCESALGSLMEIYSTKNTEKFSGYCDAVKLVFDDVQTFYPKTRNDDEDPLGIIAAISNNEVPISSKTSYEKLLVKIKRYLSKGCYCADSDTFNFQGYSAEYRANFERHIATLEPNIMSLFPEVVEDTLIISPDPFISSQALRSMESLTDTSVLMMLAASGINITLPSLRIPKNDDLLAFKEKYDEELSHYRIYLSQFVNQAKRELSNNTPSYEELLDFAKREFALNLSEKARHIELIAEKSSKNRSKNVVKCLKDKWIGIASNIVTANWMGLATSLLESLDNARKERIQNPTELADYKEASYIYSIKKRLV